MLFSAKKKKQKPNQYRENQPFFNMGEFFLPPHVSNRETFFFGKDNFQLKKKKKKKKNSPWQGLCSKKKIFFSVGEKDMSKKK